MLHTLPQLSEPQRQSLTPLIRALDVHFPQELDAAVNQLLQQGQGSNKAAAQQVFALLQAALAGSAHAPLADAHSTLAMAVDAPSAEMRILVRPSDTICEIQSIAYASVSTPCERISFALLPMTCRLLEHWQPLQLGSMS